MNDNVEQAKTDLKLALIRFYASDATLEEIVDAISALIDAKIQANKEPLE
jgi:hypothetical protein